MKTTPARECSKAFDQYIRFVQRYKLRATVLQRLNAKLQKPVRASDVHRWLHPDPRCRTEPRWGTGTLLLAVWEELLRDLVVQREKEGWWWRTIRRNERVLLPKDCSPEMFKSARLILLRDGNRVPEWIGGI